MYVAKFLCVCVQQEYNEGTQIELISKHKDLDKYTVFCRLFYFQS